MPKHTRLELTWIGKENRPRLEPRILLEDPARSYHAPHRVSENDIFDNRLIFGDNLLALKALESDYAGKVKCIFIDPPYNTGSAFTHYDDGLEHSLWLTMMRDRLELLRALLSEDGSIWITIDDNEAHYLKVLCDEVFGRRSFVANVVWEKVYSARMDSKSFSSSHDHVLVYQKSDKFIVNRINKEQNDKQFNLYDAKTQQYYRRRSLRKEGSGSRRSDRPNLYYPIVAPDGMEVYPIKPDGTEGRWRWGQSTYEVNTKDGLLEWVKNDSGWEVYVKQYRAIGATRPPETLWRSVDAGHNHEAKHESQSIEPVDVFSTPKPERLLKRILEIATNPGDLVLDSFAGSGTTGAVAQKMGRRWIMVELGEHCHTHIIPRMKKVINGEDRGGISRAVDWKGGGGFRYYRLAPSLLERDKWGNWVVSKEYDAPMLAQAMCRHEGFTYAPDDTRYWMQGKSSESDFIYTTTQTLTADRLAALNEEVGPERTLLVCCSAWRGDPADYPNLTLKKIPNAVLDRCEFGRDDYSLEIAILPERSPAEPDEDDAPPSRKKSRAGANQPSLFEEKGE